MTTERDLERLRRLPPAERLKAAGAAIEEARASMGKLAQIRADAIAELRAEGWSLGRIAKELGVTRQQIHRLMRRQS